MRLKTLSSTALCLAGLAGTAQAQNLNFNEAYVSMTGTDNFEFIELIGTPNMSLDDIVVITIDGDGLAGGKIDRVWDLTGLTVPADGYFVMGNIASVANVDYDIANGPHTTGGAANNIENGTQTFYLLRVPSALDRADLAGPLFDSDLDPDGDFITSIGMSPANFEILENIALLREPIGPDDFVYDCANALGPDGTFLPAGFFRPGDYPNDWCGDGWLDFNNPGGPDQTPGTANPSVSCTVTVGTSAGCGNMGGMGTPYCDPMDINSTGLPTVMTGSASGAAGSGLHLEAAQGPPNQFGYFLVGTAPADPGTPVGSGRLCFDLTMGNQFGRYNVSGGPLNSVGQFDASGVLQNFVGTSSVGTGYDVPSTVPITGSPTIMAGSTWHFQLWHREDGGDSNFSNALTVNF